MVGPLSRDQISEFRGSRDCEESFRQISSVGNMGLDPSSSSINKGMLQSNIGWVSNSPMVNIGAKSAATCMGVCY